MSEVRSRHAAFRSACFRWFWGVSVLAAAGGVAWSLAARAALPWVSAYVLALAVAGVMHRLARVSEAGIVLWVLAVSAFSTGHWAATVGGEPNGIAGLCLLAALVSWAASCIVFLVAAAKDRTRRAENCAGFNLASFSLIAWFVVGNSINGPICRQREVQQTTERLIELHKLGAEASGQFPRGGDPRLADDRYPLLRNFGHFWGRHHDLFGWNVYYFEPNSARRVRVVPF